jgi:hypothetical protein
LNAMCRFKSVIYFADSKIGRYCRGRRCHGGRIPQASAQDSSQSQVTKR